MNNIIIYVELPNENVVEIQVERNEQISSVYKKIFEKYFKYIKVYKRINKFQTPKDIIENPTIERQKLEIPNYRLMLGWHIFKEEEKLSDFIIPNGCLFILEERLFGAGPIPLPFADVSKGKTQKLYFSDKAPAWRKVQEGLNIFGICQKSGCEAFLKEVIYNGYGIIDTQFDFNDTKNITKIRCPMCGGIFVAKTCGFWKCEYQFTGDKIRDGDVEHIDTKTKETNGDDFEYFNPYDCPTVLWLKLVVYVIHKQNMKFRN